MKVAQNDETNPNTHSVHPPHVPSIANVQHFTSGSSVRKRETPGIFSRLFSPFTIITTYCVRAHLAPLPVVSCIDMQLFALYSLFFPLFSPVDNEPDATTGAPIDYCVDDPFFLPEQPGKPPL